ncbi:MAG: DUF374 domain-containing protein [Planctomycetaceae bacterium]|nr:DUF374 domain-containing protein [Planctomycetaceae bacterium]
MRIRSERLTKFVAWMVVATLKLLFVTCRKEFAIFPGTNGWDPDLPGRFLYSVWHDVLFFPLLMAKPHNGSALTSRHQDGAYVAETLRLLNVQPFRGSTTRGGAQAIRQFLNVAEQQHITITRRPARSTSRNERRHCFLGVPHRDDHRPRRLHLPAWRAIPGNLDRHAAPPALHDDLLHSRRADPRPRGIDSRRDRPQPAASSRRDGPTVCSRRGLGSRPHGAA